MRQHRSGEIWVRRCFMCKREYIWGFTNLRSKVHLRVYLRIHVHRRAYLRADKSGTHEGLPARYDSSSHLLRHKVMNIKVVGKFLNHLHNNAFARIDCQQFAAFDQWFSVHSLLGQSSIIANQRWHVVCTVRLVRFWSCEILRYLFILYRYKNHFWHVKVLQQYPTYDIFSRLLSWQFLIPFLENWLKNSNCLLNTT